MSKDGLTTIQLKRSTKKLLKDLKIIERESFDSVVLRLIKVYEERKNE